MHSYRRLVSTKSDGAASDLEAGIDLLLRQLQQVNAQMQAWVSSGGSEMVSHTLTRHQEILQDLTHVMVHLIITSFCLAWVDYVLTSTGMCVIFVCITISKNAGVLSTPLQS